MKSYLRKNQGLLFTLGLLLFIRSTFANEYVVPSGSMEPTIAIGDRIFVNRVAYDLKAPFSNVILKKLNEPKRGSIVVFESPKVPGLVLVKRLIAIPGDDVEIRNGFVFLNGDATASARFDEASAQSGESLYHEKIGDHDHLVQTIPRLFRPDYFHFKVPADHYFMMGDNRDNSADGRVFGLVPRNLLIGEATRVVFSLNFEQSAREIVSWDRFRKALL